MASEGRDAIIVRAADRLRIAQHILNELHLLERWRAFGNPVLVGAVAYDLVVAPDIDIEIFCDEPRLEAGFGILQACATHPCVYKAGFAKRLIAQDTRLFWQLGYSYDDGTKWNIDMWSMRHSCSGMRAADWVETITRALSDETRRVILAIKELALKDPTLACNSTHIYLAVLEAGVRSEQQFRCWLERNQALKP